MSDDAQKVPVKYISGESDSGEVQAATQKLTKIRLQCTSDWGAQEPMCRQEPADEDGIRKPRDGPSWGLGPYRGEYVINAHVGKPMFALRPTRRQPQSYRWQKRREHVYSDAIDQLVKLIRQHIKADQQVIIHIGDANGNGTGSGKSTLGLILACDIQRAMRRTFILSTDLILDARYFMERVYHGDEDAILVLDEAHEILGKNKASEKGAKQMRACFATLRSRHNIVILVSPRLSELTTAVYKEFVDFRIDCSNPQGSWVPGIGRGLFQCYLARRPQRLDMDRKDTGLFRKQAFPGIFAPNQLPKGMWEEYSKVKKAFQDVMLATQIEKARANNEGVAYQMFDGETVVPMLDENGNHIKAAPKGPKKVTKATIRKKSGKGASKNERTQTKIIEG